MRAAQSPPGAEPAAKLGPLQIIQGAHAMRDVPARARDIYRYLASLADNRTLSCTPSIAAIADDCGRSRAWVSAGLLELKEAGYIRIQSGAKRSAVSRYFIVRDKAAELYETFQTRGGQRSQTLGWKSAKAAPPRRPASAEVAATPAATAQVVVAANDDAATDGFTVPATLEGLRGCLDSDLQRIAWGEYGSRQEVRLQAMTVLNERHLEDGQDHAPLSPAGWGQKVNDKELPHPSAWWVSIQ